MFYRRFLLLLIPALLVCTLQSGCGGADQEGDLEPQESANDDTDPIGEQPVSEEPDGDELGENPDDKDVDPVTGTPPGIVSTDPEDGATGVLANSTVTIEFSAAMDPESVESAYESSQIPGSSVTFTWNEANTELTITPLGEAAIQHATGTDPDAVEAKEYSFTITTAATNAAGVPLAEGRTVTFTTMREVTQNLSPITWLTGYAYFRTDLLEMQTHTHSIAAGDSLHNEQMKGAVTIDFSTLPEDIVSFEEAIFSATQNVTHGSPYGFLGTIKMYHLTFTSLANSFSRLPLGYVGVFSDDAALETREIDVTAQLSADYEVRETRNNRSQYRIEFDNSTNNNTSADQAGFTPSSAQITVRYLID